MGQGISSITQCATAAAAASSMSCPVRKRSSAKGALIGCGSSCAMVCANTWPDPGVALNPPVPQPQFTVQARHRRLADDRAAVRRHIDDAAPVPQHPHPPELREQLADRVERVGRDVQAALLAVAGVGVGAGADHQLALVGLADVGVDRVGHDDAGKARLHGFADQRLQRVAFQRHPHPGLRHHDAGVPGRDDADAPGRDRAAGGVHPADLAARVPPDACHLAVLHDIDAQRARRPGIAPGHRIMPRRPAPALQRRAQHRVAHALVEAQRRAIRLRLLRRQPVIVDAGQLVRVHVPLGPPARRAQCAPASSRRAART